MSSRDSASPSRRRLNPAVGRARNAVKAALEEAGWPHRVLVGCSGGADSLALAAAVAHFARRGGVEGHPLEVGAVVVDHGLQEATAEVARTTAGVLVELGLSPVRVVAVEVRRSGEGPEAEARAARLAAFEAEAAEWGAQRVLLGHTLDDQAEQVLLGLARGSGTRSLGGMRRVRGPYVRPFLGLRRADTVEVCKAEGLEPWFDPTNSDPRYMRSRARAVIMPFLEAELGPGVAEGLARTAAILGRDADYLDSEAARVYGSLVERGERGERGTLLLPDREVRDLPGAIRSRVLALALVELGGQPTFERLAAVERLLDRRGSAGPIEVPGHVSVHRQPRRKDAPPGTEYGKLVFVSHPRR
ncbi:tRNA lysidine(34) synthetase TilS [Sinomonas humi]|uniref:tRNA lysidine(34) synthetase TilS n=1 Tax=Sinomonas humi TaxID=1338436 RepID=UPI000691E4FC|nr:tRNA lysidine(34) synthetase TilS [Sinomonas humi]